VRECNKKASAGKVVPGYQGKDSLTDDERQDARRAISQRRRKLIERVVGWSKVSGPLRQVKLCGLDRVDWFSRKTIVAHNVVRVRRLIPIEAPADVGQKCAWRPAKRLAGAKRREETAAKQPEKRKIRSERRQRQTTTVFPKPD
jgi:hypothetical protein